MEPIGFKYRDVPVMQQLRSIPDIMGIIESHEVETFIELGTQYGGLSLMLSDGLPGVQVHTFDIRDQWSGKARTLGPDIIFHVEDILGDPGPVRELLRLPARTLLYCDNGNKIKEVELYADHLKPGDILGVHDWGTEIGLEHICHIVTPEKFSPVRHMLFEAMRWAARFWQKLS